jgi:hypothetical protein
MLRLLESFESYGTLGGSGSTLQNDINRALYVDTSLVELVDGRGSGLALEIGAAGSLYLNRYDSTQSDTWIMGFAMNVTDGGPDITGQFWTELGSAIILTSRYGGGIGLSLAGVSKDIALPVTIMPQRWYYFEIKFYAHATAGTIEIHVNGQSVYSGSGLDTQNSTYESGNRIRLTSLSGATTVFDDIYICDGSGSYNNDFLGVIVVESLRPSSDDGAQNWTPSSGSDHYALVDSANLWQTTDYVEAGTSVDDLWGYENLSVINGAIHGAHVITTAWTDNGIPQTLEAFCDSGVTLDYSDPRGMGASQAATPLDAIWETDPDTSLPWIIANLNAASFGVRRV